MGITHTDPVVKHGKTVEVDFIHWIPTLFLRAQDDGV